MSQPQIPNLTPTISVNMDQSIIMLLSSIAMEEMALAHILNAEGEKIQYVLGTLDSSIVNTTIPTFDQLMKLQKSVSGVIHNVVLKEMLLLMKLEQVIQLNKDRV